MGSRPVRFARISQAFAAPGNYLSHTDVHGRAGHHTGLDFGKQLVPVLIPLEGQQVRSSTPGQVRISEYNETMGNWVGVYYEPDNVLLTYWHMHDRQVKVGDTVEKGDLLGYVGNTGNSTAAHLHVQANFGKQFDYQGHIAPGKWVRGLPWAGNKVVIAVRKRKARKK